MSMTIGKFIKGSQIENLEPVSTGDNMSRIVLKKPVLPFDAELLTENTAEIVSIEGVVEVIERRSALRGFEVLNDIYRIFNEYPELIDELFVIEE